MGSLSLYSVKKRFCIGCIKQYLREITHIDTDVESHCPSSIPQLYKLPTSLTSEKHNYGMCVQVIHMFGGGERQSLNKIFQCYTTSNALTAVTTAKAVWYSDKAAPLRHAEQHSCPHNAA